jgi:predicted nucleic acid-binding protein
MLAERRRRTMPGVAAEAMFAEDLAGRVLPFNSDAAVHYAEIVTTRRRMGNPIEAFDALIAATALSAGADVATRDIGGFANCGVSLIDPWSGN